MAATRTTVIVGDTYTQLNTDISSGSVSIYPIDCAIYLNVSATTTPPTNDLGAVRLLASNFGHAFKNETIASIWPGFTTPGYLFARRDGISGGAVAVACA